jgi:hypothetical protein
VREPACVDLGALRATARESDGRMRAMFVSDPHEELRHATVDARAGARR